MGSQICEEDSRKETTKDTKYHEDSDFSSCHFVPLNEAGLFERFYGGGFVVFNVEDGIEFCDLKQIVDFLGEF